MSGLDIEQSKRDLNYHVGQINVSDLSNFPSSLEILVDFINTNSLFSPEVKKLELIQFSLPEQLSKLRQTGILPRLGTRQENMALSWGIFKHILDIDPSKHQRPDWRLHQKLDIGVVSSPYFNNQPALLRDLKSMYLKPLIEYLLEQVELRKETPNSMPSESIKPIGKNVFIVHGRDELAQVTTEAFLRKIELEPHILHQKPNQGKTVIEKFESNSDVDYAVVLFTPDDEGRLAGSQDGLEGRPRQNVVLELGYFIGKLGRQHVAVLLKGSTMPILSDLQGIVYINMDEHGAWKTKLATEMLDAGLPVNMKKL